MPVMPALGRLSKEDYKIKTSLDYIAVSKITVTSGHPVAHTYNPGYSRGRD
jgi:hypothetical protein